MEWETVIGLEVHAQLMTQSKIFSGASIAYGAAPNTQACAIDLGLPGVLPVLNQDAVRQALTFGLAIKADIAPYSIFARKNYFYPDLPKGYQISQFEHPIVGKGYLTVQLDENTTKSIGITRAHLEEDAGKSLHGDFQDCTGIDLNRAGTPLLEIVSEPDMRSAKEAVAYLKTLHALVRYLHICDGNMQEGSFRCDANVSVRPKGQEAFGTRVEIKNLNSFRFIERAINYEADRQIDLIESRRAVEQETRLYDAEKNETRTMRTKEEANDYRYFPDPDLLPVVIEQSLLDEIKQQLPELPDAKADRFQKDYGLSAYDASLLVSTRETAEYFETMLTTEDIPAKLACNWINGELNAALSADQRDISAAPISSADLARLLLRIHDQTISGKIAKTIFDAMWQGEGDADTIIKKRNLRQVTDTAAIEAAVKKVIADNPTQVEQYHAGKEKVLGFFVGQIMKAMQGKANPQQVNELLKKHLSL